MNRKTKISAAAALFLILGIGIGYTLANTKKRFNTPSAASAVGTEIAKDIVIIEIGGEKRTIGDYRGKAVMINFWAAWCGPCLTEMPSIYRLYENYKARGFEVLAVSLDDDVKSGMATLSERVGQAPFPIFQGAGSELLKQFPLQGVPYTVLIDRNGIIRYSEAAPLNWFSRENRERVEKIL